MSAQGPQQRSATTRTGWETPPELFELLDSEFRFTLDAAASPANRKCERYLTEEEDALKADMIDQVIFCNPPYGAGLHLWCDAFARWAFSGNTVVALLPDATYTEWFAMVWAWADEIRFLHKRVAFVGGGSSNTRGSIVAVYRPQTSALLAAVAKRPIQFNPPRMYLWSWRP